MPKSYVRVLAATVIFFAAEIFAQLQWTERTPLQGPSGRYANAMAYDSARGRVVMFGGFDAVRQLLRDTWEWNGTIWMRQTPANSPPARSSHAMVYDAARGTILLFGGYAGFNQYLDDTWEWDGTAWSERFSAVRPSARCGHTMAYDSARKITVLFGGALRVDTWEWDGVSWHERFPAVSPPHRSFAALAFDEARGVAMLFGGQGGDYPYWDLSDTWTWNGVSWTSASSCQDPPSRQSHAVAYDAAAQRIVLFGGASGWRGERLYDTWFWNGTDWARAPVAAPFLFRSNHAMAYDRIRSRVVLFGGSSTSAIYADTWELSEGGAPITVRGRVVLRTSPYVPPVIIPGASVKVSQNSIPGWIAQGLSDTTGWYTIVLPQSARPGSYTIRASLVFDPLEHPPVVNYRYCNPAQNPELNPDRDSIQLSSGMNDNLDIYVPQPVILVHGILAGWPESDPTVAWCEAQDLLRIDPRHKSGTARPPGWNPNWTWPRPIAHRGYMAWSVGYGPWYAHIARSHESNAALFHAEVAAKRNILARYGLENVPVDIVAHSMGGLVTRAYLHLYAQQGSVDRVITFASPHVGTGYLFLEYYNPISFWPLAARQMDPVYLVREFEPRIFESRGARFILVGCSSHNGPEPEAFIRGLPPEDDGWVSQFSALYLPRGYLVIRTWTTLDLHEEIHSNAPYETLNNVLLRYLETAR